MKLSSFTTSHKEFKKKIQLTIYQTYFCTGKKNENIVATKKSILEIKKPTKREILINLHKTL
jgi:hypothetical protein